MVTDFGTSWRDGNAFLALIHCISPRLVNMQVSRIMDSLLEIHYKSLILRERFNGVRKKLYNLNIEKFIDELKSKGMNSDKSTRNMYIYTLFSCFYFPYICIGSLHFRKKSLSIMAWEYFGILKKKCTKFIYYINYFILIH